MEAIYQDRDQFAQLVREVASPDVGRMGIEILSFTIKDVYDSVEYLESLGRAQTANVKRDADIGVAEANRDAGIRVSCRRSSFHYSLYCYCTHCFTLGWALELIINHCFSFIKRRCMPAFVYIAIIKVSKLNATVKMKMCFYSHYN